MCGPDGRTSVNGVPVWWCEGPYCREHDEPVHICAEAVTKRGYVLALSPDKTLKLQQAVADMPVVGVDKSVITATPQTFTVNNDVPMADDETRLAAWGLQYEMIDEPVADQPLVDSEVSDPTEPFVEEGESAGMSVDEPVDEYLVESDGDIIDEPAPAKPLVDDMPPLVDEEGEIHATNNSTD